jgi:hypothetical protein
VLIETTVSYLKSSYEKVMVLLGLVFNITNLDSLKTHKAKIRKIQSSIPNNAKDQEYFKVVFDLISSESLESLNKYRTGILHKRGLASLQPHNYIDNQKSTLPIEQLFQELHEELAKCTLALFGTLGLLTDELVKLDPPQENECDFSTSLLEEYLKEIHAANTVLSL